MWNVFPIKNRLFLHGNKDDFAGIFFLTGKVLGGPVTFQVTNNLELLGKISLNFFTNKAGSAHF